MASGVVVIAAGASGLPAAVSDETIVSKRTGSIHGGGFLILKNFRSTPKNLSPAPAARMARRKAAGNEEGMRLPGLV